MQFALDIPPGLASEDTAFADEGRYYAMSGARFWEDRVQIMGGYESATLSLLGGVCRTILQWTDNDGNANIAFGEHDRLEVLYGGVPYNITPAAFVPGNIDGSAGKGYGTGAYGLGPYGEASTDPTFPMTWALSNYGETLIANARMQGIWQWSNNTAVVAQPVANAPAQVNYALVVPQRQLIAFGCTDLGGPTFDPMCIRGSDIEDITNWTPATDNNAFEYVLDSGSYIVTARVVANYLFVWTDSAFYLGTFIGAPDETWRFERQGLHCGSIGVNAPVVDGQVAKWISSDAQFWAAAIGSEPQVIPCPILKGFADNIAPGQADKIVGSTVSKYREVRWFYPDNRDGYENSRAIAVNAGLQWSTDQRDARTAYTDAGPSDSPISTTYAGNIYWQERGATGDGGQLTGFVETSDFYLGDAEELIQINGVWPDFKDQQGAINMSIDTRLYPQDTAVRTRGPYALAPNRRKRDFRATGRVARAKWEWAASPASGRWGKQTFDIERAGMR